MDKTKDALVLARQRLDRFEFQAEGFPLPPDETDRAILRLNRCAAADVGCIELEVDNIRQRLAVQLVYLVARL